MYKYTEEDLRQLREEYEEEKLTPTRPSVRLTSLKVCNNRLGIKYTISTDGFNIKSYIYYIGNKHIFTMLCNNWKDMALKMKLHKMICEISSLDNLKALLDKYNIDHNL